MWKRQDDTVRDPGRAASPGNPWNEGKNAPAAPRMPEGMAEMDHQVPKASIAHIGKSVQIKGELIGSEDLVVDGIVEGTIELPDYQLTVGENGKLKANVNAKKVVIVGSVKGNIRAIDNVKIRKSGSLVGDLVVAGVIIEEGAYFKGSIDIQKGGEPAVKQSVPKKVEPPPLAEVPGKFAAVPAVSARTGM